LAEIADFTNDGTADLLWQNQSTGQLEEWLIKNGGILGFVNMGSVPTNAGWSLAAVIDLNGDGTPDLLWYNQTNGQVEEWLMQANGAAVKSYAYLGVADPSAWSLATVVDLNNQGTPDLLWRNNNGQVGEWVNISNGAIGSFANPGTA
jgi:hypothetical protein